LTDIVDRLRSRHNGPVPTMLEAADEIERLRAEIALWKDRCEAEYQAHMATIKHAETALRDLLSADKRSTQ
jgi:hypothetical protein